MVSQHTMHVVEVHKISAHVASSFSYYKQYTLHFTLFLCSLQLGFEKSYEILCKTFDHEATAKLLVCSLVKYLYFHIRNGHMLDFRGRPRIVNFFVARSIVQLYSLGS